MAEKKTRQWLGRSTTNDRRNFCLVVVLAKSVSKKPIPEFVGPMMATVVKEPFDDPDWMATGQSQSLMQLAKLESGHAINCRWNRNSPWCPLGERNLAHEL